MGSETKRQIDIRDSGKSNIATGGFDNSTKGQTETLRDLIEFAQGVYRVGDIKQLEDILVQINEKFLLKLELNKDRPVKYLSICVYAFDVFSNFKCESCEKLKKFFYEEIKNKIMSDETLTLNNTLVLQILKVADKLEDTEFREYIFKRFKKMDQNSTVLALGKLVQHQTPEGKIKEFSLQCINIIKEDINSALVWKKTTGNVTELKRVLIKWGDVYFNCTGESMKQFPKEKYLKAWELVFSREFTESNLNKYREELF